MGLIDFFILFIPLYIIGCIFIIYRFHINKKLEYPYCYIRIRLRYNQRFNDPLDFIDKYLNCCGLDEINAHIEHIAVWKKECEEYINQSLFFKRWKRRIFENNIDDNYAFIIEYYRYKGDTRFRHFSVSYNFLYTRYKYLEKIGFSTTLRQYHIKKERSKMNDTLRWQILARDDFTCQICGEYLPLGNGAQIDHIIPVSKGGTTEPDNLQVLCQKCNRAKSNKLIY